MIILWSVLHFLKVNVHFIFRQNSVESNTEKSGSLRRLNSIDKESGNMKSNATANNIAKPTGDKLIEAEKAETGRVSVFLISCKIFIDDLYYYFHVILSFLMKEH